MSMGPLRETKCAPEVKQRKKGAESLFNGVMAENFPNLGRNFDIGVNKANRSPSNFNAKQFSLRHIIIKLCKTENTGRNFKSNQ